MINKKYLKLLRSRNKNNYDNFIYNKIAERIIDSIDLLKLDINSILEIGINDTVISKYLESKFIEGNILKTDILDNNTRKVSKYNYRQIDLDNLYLKNKGFNLIYSNFFIHLFQDFESVLSSIYNNLNDNGFFIASIPANNNIYQLVNSMIENDLNLYDGAYKRINPSIDIEKIILLLNKIGFQIPTINSNKININYSNFGNLLQDLKETRLSYCYKDKKNTFEKKKYFYFLENIFRKKYFKNGFNLEINFILISAWKN